jgi:integrase
MEQGITLWTPGLIEKAGRRAFEAYYTFFAEAIPNPRTRRAYMADFARFSQWCEERGFELDRLTTIHFAAYREVLMKDLTLPSVKRHFSALRTIFGALVEKGVLDRNPVREVKLQSYRGEGKTPALRPEEVRQLLDAIDASSAIGLRDRALLSLMAYSFARIGAALQMKVKDFYPQGTSWFIRLHEKGGRERQLPCHHLLAEALNEYVAFCGLSGQPDAPLFRSIHGKKGTLTASPLGPRAALEMVYRRTQKAGIRGRFCCHTFRATGITTFLENGGSLETAQFIAGHADSRTTKIYDRRERLAAQSDIERIRYE